MVERLSRVPYSCGYDGHLLFTVVEIVDYSVTPKAPDAMLWKHADEMEYITKVQPWANARTISKENAREQEASSLEAKVSLSFICFIARVQVTISSVIL